MGITKKIKDGFQNVINSLNFNQMLDTPSYTVQTLTDQSRTSAYQNPMVKKIVNRIPIDGMKKKFQFENLDPEIVEVIDRRINDLNFHKIALASWIDSRIYGQSYIPMFTNQNVDEYMNEIDENNVISIESFSTEINPGQEDKLILKEDGTRNPNFRLPKSYSITDTVNLPQIHNSRVIRVDGEYSPRDTFRAVNFRNASTIDKVYWKVANSDLAHKAIGPLVRSYNTKIIKMNNLPELQEGPSDAEENLKNKLRIIQEAVINGNLLLLFEDDEYINNTINLSNIDNAVNLLKDEMVAASGIPRTILLGDSPKGMQSSGQSELTDYYDYVRQEQVRVLEPVIRQLVNQIMLAEYGMIHDYDIYFPPLRELTELEEAEFRLKVAQQMQIMSDMGVLHEDEIRESLYRNKFSTNIELMEDIDRDEPENEDT